MNPFSFSKGKNKEIRYTYLPHSNRCRTIKKFKCPTFVFRIGDGKSLKRVKKRKQSLYHLCNQYQPSQHPAFMVKDLGGTLQHQADAVPFRSQQSLANKSLQMPEGTTCSLSPDCLPKRVSSARNSHPIPAISNIRRSLSKDISHPSLLKSYTNKTVNIC